MNPALQWSVAGLYGLLGVASVTVMTVRRRSVELRSRIASWWVMVAVFTAALLLGRMGVVLLGALASGLALRELLALVPGAAPAPRWRMAAFATVPLQYALVERGWTGAFHVVLPLVAWVGFPLLAVAEGRTRDFARVTTGTGWAVLLGVFGPSHAAMLALQPGPGAPGGMLGAAVFLVVLTELNDVAQFLWGRALGQQPVAPRISPRKTVEGLVGGVCTTAVLAGVLGPSLAGLHGVDAVLAGLLIGLGGFAGDLVVSALKRDVGVKDAGTMIPGHGGVLDRLDSLLVTAPLFFHYVHALAR